MAVRNWSGFKVLVLGLLWVALTFTGAVALNPIDLRPVTAQGVLWAFVSSHLLGSLASPC